MLRRSTRPAALFVAFVLIGASCSDGDAEVATAEDSAAATTTSAAGDSPSDAVELVPATEAPDDPLPTIVLDDYLADAQSIVLASDDRSLPPEIPEAPAGAYGFSRYVFQQEDGVVVPTLIEGPRGQQVRCQEVEKACSYLELKDIFETGEDVPDYLGMTHDELGELVAQLTITEGVVNEHNTIEEACAAGFTISSSQNPNMGIHAQNPNGTYGEFDPARPAMVLYAKEGGEDLTQAEQGNCVDGEWTGEPGYQSVGAVFTTPMTEEHPDAFAGPIDNWHIHFNTCAGSPQEGGTNTEVSESATLGSQQRCEDSGGQFMEVIPVWMMHAYVDPDHDAQGGVFAMFNPSIWPLSDPSSIEAQRVQAVDGAVTAPINNFDFGDLTVQAGESVVFTNSDSVPHTVTAGNPGAPSGAFDSGVFGTGQSFATTFATPGEYELFCVLHPNMTGVVTVE